MVDAYFDFIWRSLRGLGVPAGAADDAAQHVFLIAYQKLDEIAPAPIDAADALREQVAMIDRARDALGAGDAAGCLAALDAHDERFPRSAMAEEATVLRIEALLRLGDRARAADLGERFLASRPTSPHAAGVRALLGLTGATTAP